ncbi:hypothetical protein BOKEGFJH_00331 [Chlamydia avium]|uniref:Inner membrane protein n=1 Tax=Chlamydia avium TaxID=1457141 RepID=A0ABN0MRW6_9CHLA|nr:hypothetical protein [Chlamydia avium]EPP36420.1 hypothetical protein CP10743SC13_0669 [Chlamydia psittaci 10_743_SC13]EPP38161.1 hypothetical protein CP10881SC42_0749 [Chlamydia avium]VVT42815.1 hypothetical protein BOKEGFJH_00331 [Chlamydia avium]
MANPTERNPYDNELIQSLVSVCESRSYPFMMHPNGSLERLHMSVPTSNSTIANLMLINKIPVPQNIPTHGDDNSSLGVVPYEHRRTFLFFINSYFFADYENNGRVRHFIYSLCRAVSIILNPLLGGVVHNVFVIHRLAKKYINLKTQESTIIRFVSKDTFLSPWTKGEYIASASAMHHSRRAVLYLIADKVGSLILGIFAVLSILAFIASTVLFFNAGMTLYGITAALSTCSFSIAIWNTNEISNHLLLIAWGLVTSIIIGVSLPFSAIDPIVIFGLSAGALSIVLGVTYLIFKYIKRSFANRAISSMHRSLLSLHISEQIHNTNPFDPCVSKFMANQCLSPYNQLLDNQLFSLDGLERVQLQPNSIRSPFFHDGTMPPPYYPDSPPSYEEVQQEMDLENQEVQQETDSEN